MNKLKSIFITLYMMAIMSVAAVAIWRLTQGGDVLAWSGTLLTVAPILSVITVLMTFKRVARTSAHFPLLNLLGGVGVALALWRWEQGAGMAAVALAVAAWLGFLIYAYWFSTFSGRVPSALLQVGKPLPGFAVKGSDGRMVTSKELTDRPAVFLFYRGNWCPLCMAQLKELVGRYQEIEELGVRVAMISPQPHDNTVELAQKYHVNFDFLTDEGNAAARALGIENKDGTPLGMQMFGYDDDTVLPTVIVTDRQGRVVWSDQTDNYRIRPEPDVFLDVLRRFAVVGG